MKAGEILLVVGAAGLGIFVIVKLKNSASISPVVPGAPPTVTSNFDMSGLGAAGPLGAPLALLQPTVKGAIDKVNSTIGGANPYAGLTRNSDGTYTDGMGCKLTFKPDGTYTRVCPQKSLPGVVATGVRKVISFL